MTELLLGKTIACMDGFRFVAGIDYAAIADYVKRKNISPNLSFLAMPQAIVQIEPKEFEDMGGFRIVLKPDQVLQIPPGMMMVEVPFSRQT